MRKRRAIKSKQIDQTARERILRLMRRKDYVPRRKDEILSRLTKKPADRQNFSNTIDALIHDGTIVCNRHGCMMVSGEADLITGRIKFRQRGSAILIADTPENGPTPPPVFIHAEDTGVALHNDRVVVRLEHPSKTRRHRSTTDERSGQVIRIVERARSSITGSLQKSRLFHFVVPDDPRIIPDIFVPDPAKSSLHPKPKIGDKVVVELHEWKQRHINPEGEITEILGKDTEPDAELKAILRNFQLDPDFPGAVKNEAAKIPASVRKKDLKGRTDFRKLFTFTIDPDDARDFDDALSIEQLPDGELRVGIHIADVGTYVKPDSALDKEAKSRGNSTYLVGTVIPMLPQNLSNGICSLVENEDRLTKSVLFTFSRNLKPKKTEFTNSVIRSNKRLTYRQALALLREDDLQKIKALPVPPAHQTGATGKPLGSLKDTDLRKLQQSVRDLWRIASSLRQKRMNAGSLDLDIPEVKIFVDEEGFADRIETTESDETHQLIEEFMLLANEAVATVLTRHKIPALYRIHEKPDAEKLNEYREFLQTFNIQVGDLTNRKEIKRTLEIVKNHPQSHTLRVQFLRSLQKARYAAKPLGHYGLHKKNYTHFTSPIRRYSDLVVHRLFEAYLEKYLGEQGLSGPLPHYKQSQLDSLGEHLSITEQNSIDAEREHVKLKLIEFFERELTKKDRQTFEAVIAEVRNHGMFVELKASQAYGLVPVSSLRGDMYFLTPDGNALKGRRTKKTYEMGQTIEVQVEQVNRFRRQIDFRLADKPARSK